MQAEPAYAGLLGLLLCLTGPCLLLLRSVNYYVAAWALVASSILAILLIVGGLHISSVIFLLALAVGLAAFFISIPASFFTAALCTALIWARLANAFALGNELCLVTILSMWGTLGLIWLSQRPLITTFEWSWSSLQRSIHLLEETRDHRLQLKQALAELADQAKQPDPRSAAGG